MQEMQVQSPGQEDPLEEKIATYSSILAWKIPWTEEPGRGHKGSAETAQQSMSMVYRKSNSEKLHQNFNNSYILLEWVTFIFFFVYSVYISAL